MDFSLLETKLIWATRRVIEPASRHAPLFPDDIPVWLLLRGRVRLAFADETTETRAGHWIFPKRGPARHDFTDDATVLSLRFRLRWRQSEELFTRDRTLVLPASSGDGLRRAAERLVTLGVADATPASPERFFAREAAFHRWLEIYTRTMGAAGFVITPRSQTDPRLLRARALLEAAPLTKNLARAEVAAQVGWSLPQLTRRFTQEHGMTPRAYFEQRRLRRARVELTRGSGTIKEIAGELGFRSLAEFSNWFSRHAGVSPRSYRNRIHV